MTLKYELTKKYHRKELITVCMISHDRFRKGEIELLEHIVDGIVVETKPAVPEYKNFSHGLCKDYKRCEYFKELLR